MTDLETSEVNRNEIWLSYLSRIVKMFYYYFFFLIDKNEFIDLKRITRCKLALIFTSADHRQFLGLFGSEAARL